ncbi:MAG: peptide/nickel transport system permease protein [Halieaceae bacterium]|jgi:peptide/nickel transport system permease protein
MRLSTHGCEGARVDKEQQSLSLGAASRPRKIDLQFVFGATVALLMIFLAAFGPLLAPYDPFAATGKVGLPPPPLADWPQLLWASLRGDLVEAPHWFGTDFYGLDVFSRVIAAPRTDLTIALSGAVLSMILGTGLGVLVACYRNWWSEVLMRFSDVLQSFPVFIVAMVLVALAGRQTGNIILALCLVYTPIFLRLTRAEALGQVTRGYVEAARISGGSSAYIALRHVLPNSLGPSLIQLSVTVGFAIILTAGLSFVGAGVQPPTPEWGLMISQGAGDLNYGWWWTSLFPGLAISITVFGFAVLGQAAETRLQ